MTASYTEQYRAVSTRETQNLDALSVRAIWDIANNLNNTKGNVQNFCIRSEIYPPSTFVSSASNTVEKVRRIFAPVFLPHGYSTFYVTVGHYRSAGAGTTTWKLYACRNLYQGSTTIDTSKLVTGYDSVSWSTSSGTHAIAKSGTLRAVTSSSNLVWLLVTANDSDGTTVSNITSLSVWPII